MTDLHFELGAQRLKNATPLSKRRQSYVVSRRGMQAAEDAAFKQGLPQAALMEQAIQEMARRIAHEVMRTARQRDVEPRLVFLCGNGGNGADAWGVARALSLRGHACFAYRIPGDQTELNKCHESYAVMCGVTLIPIQTECQKLVELCTHADLIIDGLSGLSFHGPARGPLADVLHALATLQRPIVSIDIPSGLEADGDQSPLGLQAIHATRTLILGHRKPVHCDDRFLHYVGPSEVVSLDLNDPPPDGIIATCIEPEPILCDLRNRLNSLPLNAHKYTRGRCAVVAGSPEYPGAAILSLGGALAAAPGYVTLYNDDATLHLAAASRWPSVTFTLQASIHDLPAAETGTSGESARPAALLSGPGITNHSNELIATLRNWAGPVVLDAGSLSPTVVAALAPVASTTALLSPRILTPHQGEFDRIWDHFADHDQGTLCKNLRRSKGSRMSRLERLQALCLHLNCSIVLKGSCTLIGLSSGACMVFSQPNSAMARAGTGDVLSGFLAGLLARGVPEECALPAAVVLHSQAGRLADHPVIPVSNLDMDVCFPSRLTKELSGVLNSVCQMGQQASIKLNPD
jgi:hydroxyethylthiazole kinase-like uncharacterized protein yjeF